MKGAVDALRWTLYSLILLDNEELMKVLDYSKRRGFSLSCDQDEIAVTSFKRQSLVHLLAFFFDS